MSLESIIKDMLHINDRQEYIRRRAEVTAAFSLDDWKQFIRIVADRFQIPELIGSRDIQETVGEPAYAALGVKLGRSQELAVTAIPGYGSLDEHKCRVFIASTDNSSRHKLSASFLNGSEAESNGMKMVQYCWKHLWAKQYAIPEFISDEDIQKTLGNSLYSALGVPRGSCQKLLKKAIADYGVVDEQKCTAFVDSKDLSSRKKLSAAFFECSHAPKNAKKMLEYCWEHVWSLKYVIPELVGKEDIQSTVGNAPYAALDVPQGNPQRLLAKTIEGYGKVNEHKCSVFVGSKARGLRKKLSAALLVGNLAQDNAKAIIQYCWEKIWSTQYAIIEFVGERDVKKALGDSIYAVFGLPSGNPHRILRKAIAEYGKFDEYKCMQFVESKDNSSRKKLSAIFLEGGLAESNAKALIEYCWEKLWSREHALIELVGHRDIGQALGESIYAALGIPANHPQQLLAKAIANYSQLTAQKATALLAAQDISLRKKALVHTLFFAQSIHREQNIGQYLEAYQRHHQKRLHELTSADYAQMPQHVASFLERAPTLAMSKRATHKSAEKHSSEYNAIQIRWNDALEANLRHLYTQHQEKIFDQPQLLWEKLGITSFAARMKAAELGLCPPISFGSETASRLATYQFIQFRGYSTPESMFVESQIESDRVHVELFSSPVHGQGFHVQLPIVYRGIDMDLYTEREQELLQIMATYLEKPASFERTKDVNGLPCFQPPKHKELPHTLVPLRSTLPEPLCKIYLPKRYSKDPGGVFSTVIDSTNVQVFAFYHADTGEIINHI